MLNRNFAIALAVAMVLAVLYGCSSSGGIKNDRDMYKEDAEMLQGSLDAANGEVMRLTGELATATTNAADLQMQLDTSMANAADLQMQLDTSMANAADLQMQLDASMANAADLQMQLDTSNGDNADLQMQLTAETDRADGLDTQLTAETDRADGLDTQLTAETDRADGLDTQLTAETDRADGLQTMLTAETARADGLQAQLDMANSDASAAQRVSDLFAAAQDAIDDAMTAAGVAATAVETATAASEKLGTLSVAGESAMAETNAQTVLTAEIAADNAVDAANAAVKSAETALDDAEALDADTANRASLISALTAAMDAAKLSAEAAEDSRGDDEGFLAIAVGMVEGEEDMPMTSADHGEAVAMDIAMGLLPTSTTDGAGMRVTHGTMAPTETTDPMETAVSTNDHQGETWEMIVGSANVIETRIADAEGTGTTGVKAASIAGMTAADVNSDLSATGGDDMDGMYDHGDQFASSFSDGIPGIAFCGGNDCSVNADGDLAGNLAGSWYFTPDVDDEWYVKLTADADYTVEDLYVEFGHWLADIDGDTEINTYAMSSGNNVSGLVLSVSEDLMETSATYDGRAVGMSVEKVTDSDGKVEEIDSGAFTATVVLNATFGSEPTLGGTVDNFEGPATDPNWSVELLARGFGGSFGDSDAGTTTVTNGQDGEWTAQAYGASGGRPTGIFGGFNAHFSDGHAAGAYATRVPEE